MVKDCRDVNALEAEDNDDEAVRRVPTEFAPYQPWGRRVCSGRRLLFTLLGFLCVVAMLMVVFVFTGRSFRGELSAMEASFQSVNRTIVGALGALKEKETNDMKSLVKVDQIVKNLTEAVKEAKSQFKEHISKVRTSIHALNCHLEDIKRNRTGARRTICCPKGWLAFRQSCYWFSTAEKSWEEANADCENKGSKLVIITSYQEQEFVAQHSKPRNTWIGLRLAGRTWKWVDGTVYTIRRIDWRPMEPDSFSQSLLTNSADCAHLYRDGRWSDDHCTLSYNWVCESEKKA